MTFFFGAYIAETVRGGIENIPPGQVEAAKASGLTYFQTMRKIILPQALKQMLPALVGMFIAAFKDTSLAYIIGVMELTRAAYAINNRIMIYPFEIYTTVAVLYVRQAAGAQAQPRDRAHRDVARPVQRLKGGADAPPFFLALSRAKDAPALRSRSAKTVRPDGSQSLKTLYLLDKACWHEGCPCTCVSEHNRWRSACTVS
jgi:hypothetical protein